MSWVSSFEDDDRANARIIDKIVIALPIELGHSERLSLVETFCQTVTSNRAPWIAAIHDQEKDALNPHAHIILRDRDLATGLRFLSTSSKGSTERFRSIWESCANDALERGGFAARIDRRSYERQGRQELPTVHLGAAHKLEAKGRQTIKGELNKRIINANLVLREAVQIAQAATRRAMMIDDEANSEVEEVSVLLEQLRLRKQERER